jgi:hypothetical protein
MVTAVTIKNATFDVLTAMNAKSCSSLMLRNAVQCSVSEEPPVSIFKAEKQGRREQNIMGTDNGGQVTSFAEMLSIASETQHVQKLAVELRAPDEVRRACVRGID